jgi:hypothetical protein
MYLEAVPSTPLAIYKGTGNGTYTDITRSIIDGDVPRLNHARKLIFGDYNNDGRNDIFVCAHGYDAAPFPGTVNSMLLSGNGKLRPATGAWASTVGFHHGCASADIDNDGDVDVFVTEQKQGSYFLINDGQGGMTLDRSRTPSGIARPMAPVFTSELFDLDGDGHIDLLVGGDETYLSTYIYWGNGTGTFSDQRRTTIPSVAGWQNPLIFTAGDIDNDGTTELIVGRTKGTGGDADFYHGYALQVLKLNGRVLSDVTATTAEQTNASAPSAIFYTFGRHATWVEWVWLADYDVDGKLDLVASDGGQAAGRYWARNLGGGRFSAWSRL